MNLNLANKITIFRLICVPLFVISMYYKPGGILAFCIFVVAALSDSLDGYIARNYNMVTNFGKFMDPLADKILVLSAFVMMTELGSLPAWATIIVLTRELAITGFRTLAADKGIAIAASNLGKIKTISQMLTIIFYFLKEISNISAIILVYQALVYLMVLATLVSGLDYIIKNRTVLED